MGCWTSSRGTTIERTPRWERAGKFPAAPSGHDGGRRGREERRAGERAVPAHEEERCSTLCGGRSLISLVMVPRSTGLVRKA